MSDLERAVRAVVRDCLAVKPGEELLVVCDSGTRSIGAALRAEGEAAGADAVLAEMAPREVDGTEPPAGIAAAMAAADVVLAPTTASVSHTSARREASAAGVRIATLPGVTEEMLARVMSADVEGLRRRGAALAELLTGSSEAVLRSGGGGELRLSLEGREGIADDGDLSEPGAFGNLPCGEGFISPHEDAGSGTLTVDGSIASIGQVASPVKLDIEDGRIVGAEGDEAERLLATLEERGGNNIAELGIGTNEKAQVTGNILEDEKILGTVHVAFGASASIGGVVQVPVHLDCVILRPELEIDGRVVVRDGQLLL